MGPLQPDGLDGLDTMLLEVGLERLDEVLAEPVARALGAAGRVPALAGLEQMPRPLQIICRCS